MAVGKESILGEVEGLPTLYCLRSKRIKIRTGTPSSHERDASVGHRTDRICMENCRFVWKRTGTR